MFLIENYKLETQEKQNVPSIHMYESLISRLIRYKLPLSYQAESVIEI